MSHSNTRNSDQHQLFLKTLEHACQALRLEISPDAADQMFRHFCLMIDANRRFNLTRITDPKEAAVKHYADSLALLTADFLPTKRNLEVLDVGSGAGFPAVPLAIMCPHWTITAIDGTRKKTDFINRTAEILHLGNLHATHARAADLTRHGAHTFDLITLRAVGKIRPLLREIHTLIHPHGWAVFYKAGQLDPQEQKAGSKTARDLDLIELPELELTIPTSDEPIYRRLIPYQRR